MSEPFDIEKYRSIGVIRPKTRAVNRKDAAWSKDAAAYRRLRADGVQPAKVEGSAYLEQKATMPIEFQMGKTFPKKDHQHVREGERISSEIGLSSPYDR